MFDIFLFLVCLVGKWFLQVLGVLLFLTVSWMHISIKTNKQQRFFAVWHEDNLVKGGSIASEVT